MLPSLYLPANTYSNLELGLTTISLEHETGLRPGTFAAVLQNLYLDIPLLKLQNTKKLYGTKTNWCMHSVGKFGPKDTKRQQQQKNPTAISEEPGAKIGCQEKKQGTAHAPCTQHHKGVDKNT